MNLDSHIRHVFHHTFEQTQAFLNGKIAWYWLNTNIPVLKKGIALDAEKDIFLYAILDHVLLKFLESLNFCISAMHCINKKAQRHTIFLICSTQALDMV